MRFPPLGRLCQIGAHGARRRAPLQPSYDGYLLYETFKKPVGPLNGLLPDFGSAWEATGTTAANMIAGDGRLTQNVDALAGYAFNNLGVIGRKIVAEWDNTDGTVNYPPTLAFAKTNGPSQRYLHGEGGVNFFLIRLGEAGGGFTMPGWSLWSPNFALASGPKYRTELHTDDAALVAMRLFENGVWIGEQLVWDPDLASYLGNWMFAQTFDTKMGYTKITVESATDYPFPIMDARIGTDFSVDAAGFAGSVFGGGFTRDANGLTITGDSIYQGASVPIGPVVTGDRVFVSQNITAQTDNNIMALIPTGQTSPVVSEGIIDIPAGTGANVEHTFTVTQDCADTCLHIGNKGTGASSISLRKLRVLVNPPTSLSAP